MIGLVFLWEFSCRKYHLLIVALVMPSTTGVVVIVTFGAGVSGKVDCMAICAGSISMGRTISIASIGMRRNGRVPIAGAVTLGTVGTERPGMDRWFGMAADTSRREAAVNATGMTLCAVHVCMCTRQREPGDRMIETGRFPAIR
jgi:hypothetical protein